jgi:hypothetical protein
VLFLVIANIFHLSLAYVDVNSCCLRTFDSLKLKWKVSIPKERFENEREAGDEQPLVTDVIKILLRNV